MDRLVPNNVRATARLMENYRVATPVAPGRGIAAFANARGQVELVAIGGDGRLRNLRPSRQGGAAWEEQLVPTPGECGHVAAALTASGQRIVFYTPYQAQGLSYAVEDDEGRWTSYTMKAFAGFRIERVVARRVGGEVYLALLCVLDGPQRYLQGTRFIGPETSASTANQTVVVNDDVSFDLVEGGDAGAPPRLVYTLTPKVYFQYTSSYVEPSLYDNFGCNGGDRGHEHGDLAPVSFWHPVAPKGYLPGGDFLQASRDAAPKGRSLCAVSVDSDLPGERKLLELSMSSFRRVYADDGACSVRDGSIWAPVAKAGYVAMGYFVSGSQDTAPQGGGTYLFRDDLVTPATLAFAWSDEHSGGDMDVEAFRAVPATGAMETGCFLADAGVDMGYDHAPYGSTAGYAPRADLRWASHVSLWRDCAEFDAYNERPTRVIAAVNPGDALVPLDLEIHAAAFAPHPEGAAVFAVRDGRLYVSATAEEPRWEPIRSPQDRAFTRVAAGLGADGCYQVFVLDGARVLHSCRQIAPGDFGRWSDLYPLGQDVTEIALCRNGDGHLELFAVGQGERALVRVYQDVQSRDWIPSEVALPEGTVAEPIQSYTIKLAFSDSAGLPLAGRRVSLWASGLTVLNVNGRNFVVDRDSPVLLPTTATGELNCVIVASDLSSPALKVQSLEAGSVAVSYDPSGDVQEDLADVTATELLEAEDASGTRLLAGEFADQETADSMAESLRELMGMAAEMNDAGDVPAGMRARRGMRFHRAGDPSFAGELPPDRVIERTWHLDLRAGVRFRRLGAAEAEEMVEARKRERKLLHIDWGSLWHSVKAKVAQVAEMIYERGRLWVTAIIDGVEYLVGRVLTCVREIMDTVYGIFDRVRVAFRRVFEWLAFLFAWDDILLTHDAVVHAGGEILRFLGLAMPALQGRIDEEFHDLEAKIDALFEDLIARVNERFGGGQTIGAAADAAPAPDPALEDTLTTNVAYTNIINVSSQPGAAAEAYEELERVARASFAEVAAKKEDAKGFLAAFHDAWSTFAASDGFARAGEFFAAIRDDPSQLVNLLISGVLEIAKALTVDALECIRIVLDMVFTMAANAIEAFRGLLDQPIHVPLLSPLYRCILGAAGRDPEEPLTAWRLFALVLAIPATVASKLTRGVPLVTEATLAAIRESFTAENLLEALMPDEAARTGAAGMPPSWVVWTDISLVMMPVNTLLSGVLDMCTESINLEAPEGAAPPDLDPEEAERLRKLRETRDFMLTGSSIALELTSQLWCIPLPPTQPSKSVRVLWGVQWGLPLLDIVFAFVMMDAHDEDVASRRLLAKNTGRVGAACTALYGMAHAVCAGRALRDDLAGGWGSIAVWIDGATLLCSANETSKLVRVAPPFPSKLLVLVGISGIFGTLLPTTLQVAASLAWFTGARPS